VQLSWPPAPIVNAPPLSMCTSVFAVLVLVPTLMLRADSEELIVAVKLPGMLASSPATGLMSGPSQLAAVLQSVFAPPPPSHVRVADLPPLCKPPGP
jgi:hypothetical protein